MVHKAIAGVGALLTGIGLILLIVISVTEDFVIATIPGSPCTEDNPIGTLGVFTSTFDPACAQGTGIPELARYDSLVKSESPTTEFWPLFPAQNNFGGALGELPEFTTCDEFYNEDATFTTALQALRNQVLAGLTANVNAAATQTESILTDIFTGLPVAINGFSGVALAGAVNQSLVGMQGSIAGTVGGLAGIRGALEAAAPGGFGCTNDAPTLAMPSYSACAVAPFAGPASAGNLAAALGAEALGGTAFSAAFYSAVASEPEVEALAGILALHDGIGAFGLGTVTIADLPVLMFGGANALTADDTAANFSSVRSTVIALQTAAGGPGADATLDSLVFAMTYCTTADTVEACIAVGGADIAEPAALDDPTPNRFCIVSLQGGPLQASLLGNGVTLGTCTYEAVLQGIAAIPAPTLAVLFGAVPGFAEYVPLITPAFTAILSAVITGCSGASLNLAGCLASQISPPGDAITLVQEKGPIDYSWTAESLLSCTGSALQGGTCPSSSIRGLVAVTIANPATANSTRDAFNLLFNSLCAAVDNSADCATAVAAVPSATPGLESVVGSVFANANVPADKAERIAACEDDETDIAVFETAQAMIPASMAFAALGAILAGVAAALNKTPVAAVAAVFALTGGALTVGALLYIRTAPVYDLVGKEPEDFVPLYEASTGQLLGLLGGVLPLIGAVAIAISAFLNRPGSSSEMTSKVDNTY